MRRAGAIRDRPAGAGPPATARALRLAIAGLRLDWMGAIGSLLLFCVAQLPSLLPRDMLLAGVLSGLLASWGYFLGWLVHVVVRAVARRIRHPEALRPEPRTRRVLMVVLGTMAAAWVAATLVVSAYWQTRLRHDVGVPTPGPGYYLGVLAVAAGMFWVILLAARGVKRLDAFFARTVGRRLPATVSGVVSAILVVVVIWGTLDLVVWPGARTVGDRVYSSVNASGQRDLPRPDGRTRSGGTGSLVPWGSMGARGRQFVSDAPTRAQLRAAGATSPRDPIRIYVGLDSAPSMAAEARLAVRELERTGAFDRAVIVLVTPTGTGWIDPGGTSSLEYLYGGNTAAVTIQYSYLPSWISFLVDRNRAALAARALMLAVSDHVRGLPAAHRPRLVSYGESLGALGGQNGFRNLSELTDRVDGALWVGSPRGARMREEFTAERRPGSPERLPVVGDGRTVRFSSHGRDLATAGGRPPRVVYLQHASDPVAWWQPSLLFREPDWLREPRGGDVPSVMRWYPVVTFWQVSVDLTISMNVPTGHGHRYGSEQVDAWYAMLRPSGWTPGRLAQLRHVIDAQENASS